MNRRIYLSVERQLKTYKATQFWKQILAKWNLMFKHASVNRPSVTENKLHLLNQTRVWALCPAGFFCTLGYFLEIWNRILDCYKLSGFIQLTETLVIKKNFCAFLVNFNKLIKTSLKFMQSDLHILKNLMNFEATYSGLIGVRLVSIYLSNALYDHAMSQYLELYNICPRQLEQLLQSPYCC